MEKLKGTVVMVTGGTGFIGSHLVKALLDQNANVIIPYINIDRRSIFNLALLKNKTRVENVDIRNKSSVDSLIDKTKPTYICHLAAETLVTNAFRDPLTTLQTNIMGTVNLLEAVRRRPWIKKIIVASSDKAYGKTTQPYSETMPLSGDHPYDVSKSAADLICQAYFKTYNTPVVVTRFGNVYGEGDINLDRIVPGLCLALAHNKVLQIRSNGKYVRDYLYVKDVVDGYLFLLKRSNSNMLGEAYNFSSEDSMTVLELIALAENIFKQKIPYTILNIAKNEIPYQHLLDEKVRKLGWKSRYSFKSTFERVYTWYKLRY